MKRVGYWMNEKKRKKLNMDERKELFRNAGLDLVQIDISLPMEVQGPFNILMHKFGDILLKANNGDESSQHTIKDIETYLKNHPECLILDPLDSIQVVLDRYTQYKKVVNSDLLKDHRCMIPSFVELTTNNTDEIKEKLAHAGVTFPLVCKPLVAHGSNFAHQMAIIFCEDRLKDIRPPCVAMSFINHNAILYKIMVVGCKQFIIQRPSLKNLYPGNCPTVFFDTQQVSKADSDHPLNAVDYATLEDQPVKPDWVYLDKLGQKLRAVMELDLFGFDVIIDNETNQYGIIDINVFPGFEVIDGFFPVLIEFISRTLIAQERGELVNGRLLATAQDVNGSTNIQNQLNQKKRATRAKDKCISDVARTSPVIDLSPHSLGPVDTDMGNLYVGGDTISTPVLQQENLYCLNSHDTGEPKTSGKNQLSMPKSNHITSTKQKPSKFS